MDQRDIPRRRHVWVDAAGDARNPGLVLAWRLDTKGGWEANVAVVRTDSVLVNWTPAADLHPVSDDRWQAGPPES